MRENATTNPKSRPHHFEKALTAGSQPFYGYVRASFFAEIPLDRDFFQTQSRIRDAYQAATFKIHCLFGLSTIMNIFRRLFSAGPPPAEYDVFPNLAAILDAPPQVVSALRNLPADKRETRFLDFLEERQIGAIVDVHDDEDSIFRALQPCFPKPEHVVWDEIASEVRDLPTAPAEDVLRVLIRAFKDEQSVLRVFASGHDYWTCVFVARRVAHDFDTCIGSSSIVGYESPHDPMQA